MIVDHPVTRTVVRSLGLIIAAIVPLASAYFLYMFTYKETPVDTLLNQIPFVLQLLRSNSSSSSSSSSSSLTAASAAATTASSQAQLLGASLSDNLHLAGVAAPLASLTLSPLVAKLLALVQYLDHHGYSDLSVLPGYQFLTSHSARAILDPIFAFVSSHQTLVWIASIVHCWMMAEVAFYVYFWKKLARLQKVDRIVKGVGTKDKRSELFQRCLETVEEGEGAKRWIEVWFDTGRTKQPARFEDIGRTNLVHWMAWAFWAAPVEEVFESAADVKELNEMVDTIERVKKVKFTEGFNPDVDCIRLSLDPVLASHRPLVYYGLIWLANAFAGITFNLIGFTRFDTTVDEPLDAGVESNGSTSAPGLAYWHRPLANPDNKIPLVFIHGIGVGLVQYIHLVWALSTISRPLILIEVPYVSNRLAMTDCKTPDETYFAIERILKTHHYPKATFMGHSLGTMLCAAICRASPATSPKTIVDGLILADPICFLTHHSIARNFAYRTPATAAQLVMDLFAARECGTAWFIMRRFRWNECIMFPRAWKRRDQSALPLQGRLSPVLPAKTRVFLSRNDNLLDMAKVWGYLHDQVGLVEEGDELVVMDDMDHAQFLMKPFWFSKILKAAREC